MTAALLAHPRQVAFAVDDVWAAARRWVGRGVGPFFINEHIAVTNSRVFGEEARFDHSSAFAWWGKVMVELIHQHDPGPAPIVGAAGFHHVAFFVEESGRVNETPEPVDDGPIAAAQAELVGQGFPEALYAEAGGMPFAMHDARAELGHLIEIYPATERLVSFYDMVAQAAATWDGTDPLRTR